MDLATIVISSMAILISLASFVISVLAHRLSVREVTPSAKVRVYIQSTRATDTGYAMSPDPSRLRPGDDFCLCYEVINDGVAPFQVEAVGVEPTNRPRTPADVAEPFASGYKRLPIVLGPGDKIGIYAHPEVMPSEFSQARRLGVRLTTGKWFWTDKKCVLKIHEQWRRMAQAKQQKAGR